TSTGREIAAATRDPMDASSPSRGSALSPHPPGGSEFQPIGTKRAPATADPTRRLAPGRLFMFGRLCFCLGLVGFAVLQFIYVDIIPGRAPAWPAGLPGRQPVAILTGIGLLLVAFALWRRRAVGLATCIMVAAIAAWALARQVPAVVTDVLLGGSWTQAG